MRKWQITIFVTILFSIIGLAGAGWSQRPVVDYYMSGLSDTFNADWGSMTVNLRIRNRGSIDARLLLVITVTNANLTVSKLEPWIEYNETQVKFHVTAIAHMDSYSSYEIEVYPTGEPHNFTMTYTIEDNSNFWSINGMISHLFLEPNGYFPTSAFYNRTDTNFYEWVK